MGGGPRREAWQRRDVCRARDPRRPRARRIASRYAGTSGRTLIVSHGGAIKSWIAKILGVTSDGLHALAGVANTSLTLVERDSRDRHRLHSWNDTAHLEGLVAEEHSD